MRKYVVEAVGSFFLALAVASGNPVAVGLILMALMYLGASVSGANYNPGISLALYWRGRLSRKELPHYIIAQLLGGAFALGIFKVLTKNPYGIDAISREDLWGSLVMEAILFALFAQLFLVVMKDYKNNVMYGAIIGLAFIGIDMLGGFFNPALAFDVLALDMFKSPDALRALLVYVGGPLLGGLVGSFSYEYCYNSKK